MNQNQNQNEGEWENHPLMEAAQNGNRESLYEELGRDRFILQKADQEFIDNPLHVAALNDKDLFVAEIANVKPSLCRRLNKDLWSPLHIAAEKGNIETVKKLLKVDKQLSFIKGREGMVPLHCAAKSADDRSEVIKELLSACPKCIKALSNRNETALHIAIVDLLLCKYSYFVRKAAKINTTNNSRKTALDVLTKTRTESLCNGTRANGSQTEPVQEELLGIVTDKVQEDKDETEVKIRKILRKAGAKSSEDICCTPWQKNASKKKRALDSGIKWLLKIPNFLSFKVDKDTPSDVRNALLVIFVLIVAATYTTGINPPGGLWQDDIHHHSAGTSVWFDHNPNSFQVLMLFNYAGFLVSLVLVFNLTEGYPLRGPILLALLFMLVTYGLSIRILFLGKGPLAVLINGMILTVPLPVALVLLVATANWIWEIKE
ncbi:ankyrin repeat-containing protein BDA1-like [Macadamia integrifolia]|uniref:ankyrin repeat-containing protein BDA1-like n=1 Tax=Macadamia integrifolia TaxID=60698 RepID=UPI001C4E3DEF|nr:ankyrin repeat-containing protein BDA1-like [Macadamia integrifolia]